MKSPSVKLLMEELGYLGEGTIGPESLTQIISKIAQRGPNPLIGTYFDLSYGRSPQIMLIIDQPTNSAPVLEVSGLWTGHIKGVASLTFNFIIPQNYVRWMGPKTPPHRNKLAVPELLDELLDVFLPSSLSKETKLSERNLIANFITELNEVRVIELTLIEAIELLTFVSFVDRCANCIWRRTSPIAMSCTTSPRCRSPIPL